MGRLIRSGAVCAVLVGVCAACGESRQDLRIQRPHAEGVVLVERIFDGLLDRMGGPDLENEDEVLADATPGQRAIYALWVADLEVNNGGFEQFFFNTSDDPLIDEAIEGADLIGDSANGRILRAAAAVFRDDNISEARGATWEAYLDALTKPRRAELSRLDDRWVAREQQFERRLVSYVETNPGQFFR